jgi:hypothetical protein
MKLIIHMPGAQWMTQLILSLPGRLIAIFYKILATETMGTTMHLDILYWLACNYRDEAVDRSSDDAILFQWRNDVAWRNAYFRLKRFIATKTTPTARYSHRQILVIYCGKFQFQLAYLQLKVPALIVNKLINCSLGYLWPLTNAVDLTLQSCKGSWND